MLETERMERSYETGWRLPEEYVLLQSTVRYFIAHEVRPSAEQTEFNSVTLPPKVLERLRAKARSLGLWCVQSPAQSGAAVRGHRNCSAW